MLSPDLLCAHLLWLSLVRRRTFFAFFDGNSVVSPIILPGRFLNRSCLAQRCQNERPSANHFVLLPTRRLAGPARCVIYLIALYCVIGLLCCYSCRLHRSVFQIGGRCGPLTHDCDKPLVPYFRLLYLTCLIYRLPLLLLSRKTNPPLHFQALLLLLASSSRLTWAPTTPFELVLCHLPILIHQACGPKDQSRRTPFWMTPIPFRRNQLRVLHCPTSPT